MVKWEIAVFERRSVRAEALVAATVPADDLLGRRVWLRLVRRLWGESSAEYGVGSEMEGVVKRRKGGGGIRAAMCYDWTCTQYGWGGRLITAGHATCSKCEWQCLCWCEAVARVETDDEDLIERLVQQRPRSRRVIAGVQRRMRDELRKLQGGHVEQQGNRQMVEQTRRIGSGATAGGQCGGFQLPRPRPKAVEAGCESFQFLTTGSGPVDKTGRLPEEAKEEMEVKVVAAEVNATLAEVRAAVIGDMAVDADGTKGVLVAHLAGGSSRCGGC